MRITRHHGPHRRVTEAGAADGVGTGDVEKVPVSAHFGSPRVAQFRIPSRMATFSSLRFARSVWNCPIPWPKVVSFWRVGAHPPVIRNGKLPWWVALRGEQNEHYRAMVGSLRRRGDASRANEAIRARTSVEGSGIAATASAARSPMIRWNAVVE